MQLIHASEEHARLVAARQQVATDERWPAMFRRIVERFPDVSLMNGSLYLPTGGQDACNSFTLSLPGAADHRMLCFQVSFLAPYYMIYGSRIIDIVNEPRKDSFRVIWFGLHFHVERSPFDPELIANVDDEPRKLVTTKRDYVTFDLLPDERPYADWKFADNDCLVFGPETRGLPAELLDANWERCLTIPMQNKHVRSLNLATSVGIVLYEAIRQLGVETA